MLFQAAGPDAPRRAENSADRKDYASFHNHISIQYCIMTIDHNRVFRHGKHFLPAPVSCASGRA